MRVPWIPALLLTATCCLSGCVALNGTIPSGQVWVDQDGGAVQQASFSQKGEVIQKGHVHQHGHVVQKGVVQKGVVQKGVVQKGVVQKGGLPPCPAPMGSQYRAAIHQNLWNHFEPSGCCDQWDPVLGSCQACGVCGGACVGRTPTQHMKHMLTCASGCGEIYWGDWINYPPDACDPCDDCGNWTGPTGCAPSCLETLSAGWCNLFGYRHGGGKGGSAGCASCGGKGGCDDCGEPSHQYYDMPLEDGANRESSAAGQSAGEPEADGEVVPAPEMESDDRAARLPRSTSGFRIPSARFTR